MTDNPHAPPTSQSAKPVAWRYHYPGAEELAEVRLYEGMSCEEEAAGMVETPLYAHPPATASQSDEALINVGPINRVPGTDSISCPGLPSGMMCFGWGEQGWAINDKDGKRIAAGNWGECATLPASQSEALVDLIAHEMDIFDRPSKRTSLRLIRRIEALEARCERVEAALTSFDAACADIETCGDGNCVVLKPKGQHTNGGCHCYDDRMRMLRFSRVAAYFREQVHAALEEAGNGRG